MALTDKPSSMLAKELRDCQEKLNNLSESLKNQTNLSEIKERTIQNLRQEIRITDKEASDKKREIEKLNSIVQHMRLKMTGLETENKVLQNQAKVMEDSNRKLHKELSDTRNTLRLRDTKAQEVKAEQASTTLKYTQVLRAAIDKSTRFNCFLQQLEFDFLPKADISCKRLQSQRITIEETLKEQNLENKRYPQHRRHSHILLDDEKENLKKGLEKVCTGNCSLNDVSVMDKVVENVEADMVECLKSRLSVKDHAITEAQNTLQSVKAEVRELNKIEHEQVNTAKRMEEKIRTWRQLIDEDLKELNNELSSAQQGKEKGTVKETQPFSVGCDSRIRSLLVVVKASREEMLEIKKAINSLVSKTEVTNNPLSDVEKRILSLNQRHTKLIEEKLGLADELIDSQNNLVNLEILLGNQTHENSGLNKQLSTKRKLLQEIGTSLQEALEGKLELERKLNATNRELKLLQGKKEAERYKTRLVERAHRVELNFTPISQSTKERPPESPRGLVSEHQPENLRGHVAHKAVQVGRSTPHSTLSARNGSDTRQNSARRVSKAELKLTVRCNKETQTDPMKERTLRVEAALDEGRREYKDIWKLNQDLLSRLERQEKEIERLTNQIENKDHLKSASTGFRSNLVELRLATDGKEQKTWPPERHEDGMGETEADDILQNCTMDLLHWQDSLGNKPVDTKVLKNQKDELEREMERKDSEMMKPTQKEFAREWQELSGTKLIEKEAKVKSIITQMEEKRRAEAEKNAFYGQKYSDQHGTIQKMKMKTEYLEKRNKQIEKELEDQRKLVSSLRVQRLNLQGRMSSQDKTDEIPLDERSLFKEEILELQHAVKSTILQKESITNKLQHLRDELQRETSTLEAQEDKWYETQTSQLQKQIENTLEEKGAVEKEIEDLQTKLYRRRMSRITAEVNEYERKHSLSYTEGTNTRNLIFDLKEAIEKAQEHEQAAKTRVRELERELDDKREIISAYLCEKQIPPQESEMADLLRGSSSTEKGNDDDRKLRREFRLLNQEIGTLRKRVEIRERSLETKVKELAQKEFLIQKVIQEKNREMEEMEIKFRCRLQEQLEKLHKELTDGKDFLSEASAKEENLTLNKTLTDVFSLLRSNEEVGREQGLAHQTCKDLESIIDALRERHKLNQEDTSKDKKSHDNVFEIAEKLSHTEEKCKCLETFRRIESELETRIKFLVEENERLEFKMESTGEVKSELAESQEKCRALEESIGNFRAQVLTLEDNCKESQYQNELLEREKLCKDKEIRHLEKTLDNALKERNSTISAKDSAADQLKRKVQDMEKMAQHQDQENVREVRNKLQEVEIKYAVVKDENQKLEKEMKIGTEKMFQLRKSLSDAQAEIKTQEERIKSLNNQNARLKEVGNEKDESLRREERLRMENMKTLDALKIKWEKTESSDKRQRERLFSLKSACSEANEAYEIVKKQNMELRNDMKESKKKLDEQDVVLEIFQKEKKTLQEHILNTSRSIDELKKFSRCERVSPDSALGISIASFTSDLSSGPNSPNSDIRDDLSDSAFLPETADEKYGAEGDLLWNMTNIIENFRAVVVENETMHNRLGELLVGKEKTGSQILEYSKINTSLRKDGDQKDKRLASLESRIKLLDDDLLASVSKIDDMEQCLTLATSESAFMKKTLADREAAIEEMKEKMELLEEREKTVELYSKSVSEKYKYEESEKKKLEDINIQLLGEVEEHKKRLRVIENKLSRPCRETGLLIISYPDATDGISMETTESKLDAMLTRLGELETSLNAVQSNNIDLQRNNEDLQYANDELRKYESLSRELEAQVQDFQVRDEVAAGRITHLENQNGTLEDQNKENEEAIQEYKKKVEELEERVESAEISVGALERANKSYGDETEKLRVSLRRADESCSKKETELSSALTKLSELEITNGAYKAENEKLQHDLKALSEAKSEAECRISEAERHERKLNEDIEQKRTHLTETEKQHQESQNHCKELYQENKKLMESVSALEQKLEMSRNTKDQLEKEAMTLSSENSKLSDQLSLVMKDLSEVEKKLKNSIVQEDNIEQQLKTMSLQRSKLTSAYETNVRQKNAIEKSLVEANGQNEELEICLDRAREERTSLLEEVSHKEEQIQQLEKQKKELKEDKQRLTNDVYFGTWKILALQQDLETLRGDATLLGKDLRGIIQRSLGKECFTDESDKRKDGDEESDRPYEILPQSLRQNIKATERILEAIRTEARITDLESKSCQREVDGIHKEFSSLREQLRTYKQQSHKFSDEVKMVREELATKQSQLLVTIERYETIKEENLEKRDTVSQLQCKGAELEALLTDYENKAEASHVELMRANQHITSLEANLTRNDQKKISQEKELLVSNEKIHNLEANLRAMKEDGRIDKRRIASLEVEYSEKQALARELEKTDAALTDLRFKYGDVLKEKEEVKTELASLREELKQEQLEVTRTRKEAESLKRTMYTDKDRLAKAEQDLTARTEQCEAYKNNLQKMERSLGKLKGDNACLEEKVILLEDAGTTLNRETEIQNVEMRRLENALQDTKNNLKTLRNNYECCEKESRRLTEELMKAEEKVSKLQGTCDELLKEKNESSFKLTSLNQALELAICSKEEIESNLKQDLMLTKKELSVTSSSLERSQKKFDELQEETMNNELKIKALEEKKQDALDKYWTVLRELTEAEASIDNLRIENNELQGKCAADSLKIQLLKETLNEEREENEKEIASGNENMRMLKNKHRKVMEERDVLNENLEHTRDSLAKVNEELQQTTHTLSEKERCFKDEMCNREEVIEDVANQNINMKDELAKTKSALKEASLDNRDLRERLNITAEKVEGLEKTLDERNNEIEDLLAEAHAKLNVVRKMKVFNSGESFAELPAEVSFIEDTTDGLDHVNVKHINSRKTTMKEVVTSYHRTCLSSLNNCRNLQERLCQTKQESDRLEDNLKKERAETAEIKKYLQEVQKKRTKSEEDVKRLRKRLESLKVKSIEVEKEKDNEITQVKGDNIAFEKYLWNAQESLEKVKAKLHSSEEEKDQYAKDLDSSRKAVAEAKQEIKSAQGQLDLLQENMLQLKKRIYELEATEKLNRQQLQEKEKELHITQLKIQEFEKLCNDSNKKKTELYQKVAKAEEKIGSLESDCTNKSGQNTALESKVTTLKSTITDLEKNLDRVRADLQASRKERDGLQIHRASLESSNNVLKQQAEEKKNELNALHQSLGKTHEENAVLRKELIQKMSTKENLENHNKALLQEQQEVKKQLHYSDVSLRGAEDKLVKSFKENESLKRQHIKTQSSACADLAQKQLEMGKLKAETCSLKQELIEKNKALNDALTKSAVTRKENEFLKKELGDIHHQKSDLKLDLTSTTSKLQSYVLERESWEREVKQVVTEIEKQKNANNSKEQRLERMRIRYEQEVNYLQQRVKDLEREMRVLQDGYEQERHTDEIAYKLALESKDMEIDNLNLRLKTTRLRANDKSNVLDVMKGQLDQRSEQIEELADQIRCLKDSYQVEVASLQADLKCAHMEKLLQTRGDPSFDKSGYAGQLLEQIQSSRKESDRLRIMLGSKMKEMKSFNNNVTSEQASGSKDAGYSVPSTPYSYKKSARRIGLLSTE